MNGNVAVLKSMMGDITDSTNIARVFAFIPITWAVGGTLGQVRFPEFLIKLLNFLQAINRRSTF